MLSFGWLSALLHVWPRDRWFGPSIWFYATPWGVILALAIIVTLCCALRKSNSRRTMRSALVLTILAGAMWLWNDWNWTAESATPNQSSRPIRLLFWNTAGGRAGWDFIAREVHKHDPDIVCFVEVGRTGRRSIWQSHFPEYEVSILGERIVCMVRGTSGECDAIDLTSNSRLRVLPVEVKGQEFHCAIVDIESSIFNSRETPLSRLTEELSGIEGPLVIAGDFNTPLDSVHLTSMHEQYSCAFHKTGAGHGSTWPLPLPVLSLDQVWCSNEVTLRSFNLGWSSASDHRPVIVEFAVETTQARSD